MNKIFTLAVLLLGVAAMPASAQSNDVSRTVGDGDIADFALEYKNGVATLYLAKKPTNEPFSKAQVSYEATEGDKTFTFSETANPGIYEAKVEGGIPEGQILLQTDADTDSLDLEPLQIVTPANAENSKLTGSVFCSSWFALLVGLIIGAAGMFAYSRWKHLLRKEAVIIFCGFALFSSGEVYAHGDEIHGEAPGTVSNESGAEVYLEKKSQFLIGVRTHLAISEPIQDVIVSYGHIIPVPQKDALVTAPQSGFIKGVKDLRLRQRVKKGEVLAYLESVSDIPIVSPINGQVIELDAVDGARVEPGAKIARITNTSTVWMDAEVFPQDLIKIKDASSMHVEVEGLTEAFNARLVSTSPISEETRTAKVFLALENPQDALKIGSFATVYFSRKSVVDGIVIPKDAVLNRAGDKIVFIQTGPETFESREVKVDPSSKPGKLLVSSGINPKDRVVISGNYQLLMKAK